MPYVPNVPTMCIILIMCAGIQVPLAETFLGTDAVYRQRFSSQIDNIWDRMPGLDGAYQMNIVYAAAQDMALVEDIPFEMRIDMTDLLFEYFLLHTQHNTSQKCMESFLLQWSSNRQVCPDFRYKHVLVSIAKSLLHL
jgi:hypothetical protein